LHGIGIIVRVPVMEFARNVSALGVPMHALQRGCPLRETFLAVFVGRGYS